MNKWLDSQGVFMSASVNSNFKYLGRLVSKRQCKRKENAGHIPNNI